MRKIIARILALIVCIIAAVAIYTITVKAYKHQAIKDFIYQGENFSQNKPVTPETVRNRTTNGKFVRAISTYWKNFQDLNNSMDTETNKMLGVFEPKNLATPESIDVSMQRMEEYRANIQRDSDALETNVQNFIAEISTLDQKYMELGDIQQVKAGALADAEFRKNIVDTRKTIASYMYSALEFLQSRQGSITFAENGAILFKNPADQKYFYDLLAVIRGADKMLKDMMVENRNELRPNILAFKSAYEKAMSN